MASGCGTLAASRGPGPVARRGRGPAPTPTSVTPDRRLARRVGWGRALAAIPRSGASAAIRRRGAGGVAPSDEIEHPRTYSANRRCWRFAAACGGPGLPAPDQAAGRSAGPVLPAVGAPLPGFSPAMAFDGARGEGDPCFGRQHGHLPPFSDTWAWNGPSAGASSAHGTRPAPGRMRRWPTTPEPPPGHALRRDRGRWRENPRRHVALGNGADWRQARACVVAAGHLRGGA